MVSCFKKYSFSVLIVLSLFMAGCATTVQESEIEKSPIPEKKGVYHKVGKGQTLWRIAKTYNISIDDIIIANSIPNVAKVEENQLIFIPGADHVHDIPINTTNDQADFIWPVKGKVVHYFREPMGNAFNNGIKILAQQGDAVKASRSGKVVLADYLSGYGQTIILDHGDGYYSVYANNDQLLVKLGDAVNQGTDIAYFDKDQDSTYLHFEIRKKTVADNPLFYLP